MKLIDRSKPVLPVKRPLTPEQKAAREEVQRRTELIQAGVAPPRSGVFGKPYSERKAAA